MRLLLNRCLAIATIFLLPLLVANSSLAETDLDTIMQNPDWIGPPVEATWWDARGDAYYYRVKRPSSAYRDVYRVELDSGTVTLSEDAAALDRAGEHTVTHRDGKAWLVIEGHALLWRSLGNGARKHLYSGSHPIRQAQFAANGTEVFFETDGQWWSVPLAGGAARQLTNLQFTDDPEDSALDALAEAQLRLFNTLSRERTENQQQAEQAATLRSQHPELGPNPWFLGEGQQAYGSALSADGRWLILALAAPGPYYPGQRDKMPHYVTESGYVEIEDVHTLVGRDGPKAQSLVLLDLDTRTRHDISLDDLPGRAEDPLADLKTVQGLPTYNNDNPRPFSVMEMVWHPTQADVLLQLRANDNKDRWIVRLHAPTQNYNTLHRLTDPAWINWNFNDMGWVGASDNVWYLSEETGYSQLYRSDTDQSLTTGSFEVSAVQWDPTGRDAYFMSNQAHPTQYDLYRRKGHDGTIERLTHLEGLEGFDIHPLTGDVLLRYSDTYLPMQAAVLRIATGDIIAATDTRTADYRVIDWQEPTFVGINSSHIDAPVWSKFYPAQGEKTGPRPAVIFVHGAGYTQNTHHRFPYYFREQMFHNLLTERGYHVLDMDFRASEGYGRDWRTAIYRQMGTPELEDLIDGVNWLVTEHQVDPERVGVYGGSYGGFMTFMAMFKAPEVFAAGAALRPVTDFRHYNHGYTSNILNTPEVDPEAHQRSAPIEFAEGLQGHLLISHGMLDDNVFYKDSVRLVQRLIELKKENWELASYPLEAHAYVHPESWLDQYRRILKLFEETIGEPQATD